MFFWLRLRLFLMRQRRRLLAAGAERPWVTIRRRCACGCEGESTVEIGCHLEGKAYEFSVFCSPAILRMRHGKQSVRLQVQHAVDHFIHEVAVPDLNWRRARERA